MSSNKDKIYLESFLERKTNPIIANNLDKIISVLSLEYWPKWKNIVLENKKNKIDIVVKALVHNITGKILCIGEEAESAKNKNPNFLEVTFKFQFPTGKENKRIGSSDNLFLSLSESGADDIKKVSPSVLNVINETIAIFNRQSGTF